MNIGYITNSPAPYRTQQMNCFQGLEGINLTIYYSDKRGARDWNFDQESKAREVYLKQYYLFKYQDFNFSLNTGLIKIIKENDLIIIGGYEQFSYFVLSILCRIYKKEYILLFDGIQPQKIGAKTNFLKHFIIRTIVKKAKSIFANGTVSKLYFQKNYCYDANKIYNQYLTVDIHKIDHIYQDRQHIRQLMKEKYNISDDKHVLLCVGRLIDLKNVGLIFDAVKLIQNNEQYTIMIVGDGPERLKLEEKAKSYGINVIFTGNIPNPTEVFKYYMVSDLFVFPTTHEAWGLVVNEAMAAGLPVLCSKGAGASMDLIKENENGFTFDYNNPEELSNQLKMMFEDSERLLSYGVKSKEIIKEWTFDNSKASFYRMLLQEGLLGRTRE